MPVKAFKIKQFFRFRSAVYAGQVENVVFWTFAPIRLLCLNKELPEKQ